MIPALALIAGLTGLLWGADRFVYGAAGAARNLGIAPMVIGLTVVSIGTSAPEIIVSVNAALQNAGELAVGNALGSNLANIGLVLGITALVAPLPVQRHLLREEGPVLLLVTALAGAMLFNAVLGRAEALLLVLIIAPLLWITVKYKKAHPDPELVDSTSDVPKIGNGPAVLWFVVGLGILLVSSELTVWSAKTIAVHFGVSELIIGLTVVAIGTSLPELAASVISAIKGHHEIAIGNVIGSNLFNILAVMGAAGVIAPLQLSPEVFARDFVSMALLTVLMMVAVALAVTRKQPGHPARVGRGWGALLLALYAGYFVWLFGI